LGINFFLQPFFIIFKINLPLTVSSVPIRLTH
jgi:hypothetical protein